MAQRNHHAFFRKAAHIRIAGELHLAQQAGMIPIGNIAKNHPPPGPIGGAEDRPLDIGLSPEGKFRGMNSFFIAIYHPMLKVKQK